ncbi:MAG TPA: hypothetical protein VNL18_02025 [Gemmatimonadales bacterium]|nr:hypothetical protein [Gemmatimonadales bacterium]
MGLPRPEWRAIQQGRALLAHRGWTARPLLENRISGCVCVELYEELACRHEDADKSVRPAGGNLEQAWGFGLGEPEVDTTSIDNAAYALESRAYYIQRVGSDGFKVYHKATIRKAVNDRRASLDEETEVKPAIRKLVEDEFRRGATIPIVAFPSDGAEIPDTPRLSLVIGDPDAQWTGSGSLRSQIAEWTRQRWASPRLYPAALVWCLKKPGNELREKVEWWLAWQRVAQEVAAGTLGGDYDRTDRAELQSRVADAEAAAKDEVWGGYRYAVVFDRSEPDGLKVIDLGAGHSSGGETLCGRVLAALKSQGLLNESIGAGYLDRNWPPALRESGAWPLASLRQSFLDGSLTRLFDPDRVLKAKIVDFVKQGEFGLASGRRPDGTYERVWFQEPVTADEVAFESDVFLLRKAQMKALKAGPSTPALGPEPPEPAASPPPVEVPGPGPEPGPGPLPGQQTRTIRLAGDIPPELWNRLGMKILPKLRATGTDLRIGVHFSVTVPAETGLTLERELRQLLQELGLDEAVRLE